MPNYFAIMWDVQPGSEDKIRELFSDYGRPDHDVKDADGNVVGKLLGTQVYMKGHTIVRVIEFEGSIVDVAPHMGRQPAIKALEDELDNYLVNPRDMSTPEGARKFFMETAMETLIARRWDDP
jgi:SchA/CurD like domain